MTILKKSPLAITERFISENIPFSHHANDTVIVNKLGEYISTIKIGGRAFVGEDYDTLLRWINDLNTAIKGVFNSNYAIHTYLDRHKVSEYYPKEFNNYFSTYFDERYSQDFDSDSLLVNDLYLSVVFRPQIGGSSLGGKMSKLPLNERIELQQIYVDELEKAVSTMFALLQAKNYQPVLLGKYEKEDDSNVYCSQIEFFHYILTRERKSIAVRKNDISDYICNHRVLFSPTGEFGEIRHIGGEKKYFAMLDVKEYPEVTEAGHINALMKSNFEFMLCQTFVCIEKREAKGFLKQQKKFLNDAKDMSISQISELEQAMDDLDSGRFILGHHYLSLQVFGKSITDTQNNLNSAYTVLTDLQFILTRCDMSLEGAFFSMLPSNVKFIPRPASITSFNLLCFSSFHNNATGKPNGNPWGSAVMPLKTLAGSPMYFNFHSTPLYKNNYGAKVVANTGVFGQSGAGKTVFLGATLSYLNDTTKNVRQVIFDKDYGMSAYVQAVNGYYYTIERGVPTGLNPLQVEDKIFIKDFIKALVKSDEVGFNHYDDEDVSNAIDLLFEHDLEDRNLSIFCQGLRPVIHSESSEKSRPVIQARLEKWLRGNELGYLFDNNIDTMVLDKYRVFGFEVGEFIDDDTIREPIMTYLLHRTKEMINGEPFVYVFDEFWKMLSADVFQKLIKDELKTIRKKNGFCYFLTQEPNDVLSHPLANTLVSQLTTLVLLENEKANKDHYLEGLKLTESEFDLVKSIPEKSRQLVIKNANQISVATLNLSSSKYDNVMSVLSGTPDNAFLIQNIKEKLAKNKINKVLSSEFNQSDITLDNWRNVYIPSEEWLPVFWNELKNRI